MFFGCLRFFGFYSKFGSSQGKVRLLRQRGSYGVENDELLCKYGNILQFFGVNEILMNGIKNNFVVLDQIGNGCFLFLKSFKNKKGKEFCKFNFCGLEDVR